MSRSGNPFQLVTLTVVSYISPEGEAAGHTYQPMFSIRQHLRVKTDSITRYRTQTAKSIATSKVLLPQATTLQSLDGLATLFVGEGLSPKDSTVQRFHQ